MKFVDNLSEKEYRAFWKKSDLNHFMQSYEWGQASYKNRQQIPYYVGLKQGEEVVAAALLLKKETPFKMSYFYSPRGFTIDYYNDKILTAFTAGLKKFLKKENAIYLKMDPALEYQDIDENAQPIKGGFNNYALFDKLISLGYVHQGFNKLFEKNQPRYTFRFYFENYNSFQQIENNISRTFKRQINRSNDYGLEVFQSDDIKTFHDLIKIVSKKDGFGEYGYDYYHNVFKEFAPKGNIKNYVAKINPPKLIAKLKAEQEKETNEQRKERLQKDINYFTAIAKSNKDPEVTIISMLCVYSVKGAWALYVGKNELAEYTGAVNRLIYEFIKDAYEAKYVFADLFGTVGDPQTKYMNLAGIHEYKRKLGGEYLEFIGEFDLVNKKIWYKVLPICLKIYRKLIKLKKR